MALQKLKVQGNEEECNLKPICLIFLGGGGGESFRTHLLAIVKIFLTRVKWLNESCLYPGFNGYCQCSMLSVSVSKIFIFSQDYFICMCKF